MCVCVCVCYSKLAMESDERGDGELFLVSFILV